MRLDENLNYIISDECKECQHYQEFADGPRCINGVPDLKCKYYQKKCCKNCGYEVYSEKYNLIFCKHYELFAEEHEWETMPKSCHLFHIG